MPASLGQFQHGVARDSFENPGIDRRCQQLALVDDEQVVAGALSHFAFVVEHHRFDAPRFQSLHLGHDVIEVIERLDPWAESGRMIANRRRGHQFQAFAVKRFGIQRDAVGDDDDLRIAALVGSNPSGPLPRVTTKRM